MKKHLILVVCYFKVFTLFNCFLSGQTETREVSISELKGMEGTFEGSLTIVTKDTTFEPITSWKTTDSSLVFYDYKSVLRNDYIQNNFPNKYQFPVRSLGEISVRNQGYYNKSGTFIKPDTVSVSFASMEKITYKEPYRSKHSSDSETSKETPSRYGGEVSWRKGELTLAIINEIQIGIYRMVVKVNTTFLSDNGDQHTSSSALYTLGYMFVAGTAMGTIHRDDVGEKGQMIYALILGSPLLLTNAEHHLFIVNAPGYYPADPYALSSFIAFRTDYYGPKWIVYSTDIGLQFELNWENEDGYSFGKSVAFKGGYEFTYDGKDGDFWTSRPFIAVDATF